MAGTTRFQVKQMIKQAVQNVVLPVCYTLNRAKAVDPKLVVFADAHHNSRPAAMELLYRSLQKSGQYRIVEHYLDYGTASAGAVAKHSTRFMQLYASAGFVVICDNFLPVASCSKRSETKVIQLWHACGCYKRFGYDAKDDIPEDYHGANVYRNADLVTVSGEAAVKPFASAMRLPEKCVRAIGVSRTDLYFRESWREHCREQFYKHYPQARGKQVVLWAPTFRGNAGMPELEPLDLEHLQQELGERYFILASLHPHMRHDAEQKFGQAFLSELSTEDLYPVVDVLIADYSSLIYEYLLFRKPLVMYVPDLEEYRRRRGFYMEIEKIPAQTVLEEKDLAGAIRAAEIADLTRQPSTTVESDIVQQPPETGEPKSFRPEMSVETEETIRTAGAEETIRTAEPAGNKEKGSPALETFLSTYMGACDGHATERIAEWIASGGNMR